MELLVVISLIVLLIAMLSPALHKAKYAARLTECEINIHGQWQAQTILADSNAGRFWRHNDFSADYYRSGNAAGSLWEAMYSGGYLKDGMLTICPIQKGSGGVWNNTGHLRYKDPHWKGSTYAGWNADTPQVLTTYLWFANYQTGSGTVPSGAGTIYQDVGGSLEPTWPTAMRETSSDKAMITHRISGGSGYASHDLGHNGFGLAINETALLVNVTEQPVGFADGHVITRPASEILQRTLINTGGIGYYWY
jgi:hypothetical protein